MKLELTSAPANKAIEYSDLKGHLRLTTDDDQSYIEDNLLPAMIDYAEKYTGRALVTQTWKLYLDAFPSPQKDGRKLIYIPKPPLQSITSIKYYDVDDTLLTLAASEYNVDTIDEPGVVELKSGNVWPGTKNKINAIEITFVAGYGAAKASVPGGIKTAMLMLGAHFYLNRTPVMTGIGAQQVVAEVPISTDALLMKHMGQYVL